MATAIFLPTYVPNFSYPCDSVYMKAGIILIERQYRRTFSLLGFSLVVLLVAGDKCCIHEGVFSLPELTVFAATAIVAGRDLGRFVIFGLAVNAQAHAGNRIAPRVGDRLIAFLAVTEALALG